MIAGNKFTIPLQPVTENIAVLIDQVDNSRGVSVGVWFPQGSGHETPHTYGVTHFMEHMLFKGTKHHTAAELSRIIDRVGGYLNAFTERDMLCLHCTVPAAYADLALGILLEMCFETVFTEADFLKEKDIIKNEILASDDDIEEAGHDLFFSRLYPDHPFGRKIAGEVEDLSRLSLADLLGVYGDTIIAGRCLITVAGAIERDATYDRIRAIISGKNIVSAGTSASSASQAAPPATAVPGSFRTYVKAGGSQTHVYSAIILPEPENKWRSRDFWSLSLVSSAFGESMSSRLFMRLREELGLCYSISSFIAFYQFSAHWGITASTSPEQYPAFVDAYSAEFDQLARTGLSETEISEAVTRTAGYLSLAADDTEYRMKRMARQYFFEQHCDTIEAVQSMFSAPDGFSGSEIMDYIGRFLRPDQENLLVYGKLDRHCVRKSKAWGMTRGRI